MYQVMLKNIYYSFFFFKEKNEKKEMKNLICIIYIYIDLNTTSVFIDKSRKLIDFIRNYVKAYQQNAETQV